VNQPDQQFVYARYGWPLALAVLTAVILGTANLVLGDLNQDEGWYLYAAQRIAEGWLPYRDFAFTQGPMLPLVYSIWSPVIDQFGVGGGRAVTWAIGSIAALLAGLTARRLGGASAGIVAFTLVSVNVYQSYFTTVVKTYSLCSLFMMLGLYALTRWVVRGGGSQLRCAGWLALAGAGLAAAAGTRISSGILLPLVGLWLLVQPARWGRWSWVWFGAGGGAALIIIFLPFYVVAPEGFRFGLIDYHTLREGGDGLAALVFKGGFISRLVQAYFVAIGLLALMAIAKIARPFRGSITGYHQTDSFALVRLLWMVVGAVTMVHFIAPFPYDDYQVPVFPVLAVALAVSWSYALRAWSGSGYRWQAGVVPSDPKMTCWFVWGVLLLCIAAAFSSPINQDWMIAGRDRIWWKMKPAPSLFQLREVARDIRSMAGDEILLTQDTYLAVEAGMKVPADGRWDLSAIIRKCPMSRLPPCIW